MDMSRVIRMATEHFVKFSATSDEAQLTNSLAGSIIRSIGAGHMAR